MDDDQQFCLRWNNHQSTLISVFDTLLENGTLVDCTLAAEGKFLKAHKVVLSACSPYFASLLSQQYDKHPIFILKDVKFQELRAMMDYMYRGEVNISQDQLAALLKAAESLQIKGLSDSRSGSAGQKNEHKLSVPANIAGKSVGSTGGYTLEQKRPRHTMGPSSIDSQELSGSREGSSSPTSRKRKKIRRRSVDNVMADNHEHSNSSSHSMQVNSSAPPLNTSAAIASVSTTAATSSLSTSSTIATVTGSAAAGLSVTKKTESVLNTKLGSMEREIDNDNDDNQDENEKPAGQVKKEQNKRKTHGDSETGKESSEMLIEPKSEYDDGNDENVEDLTLDDEELLEDLEQAGPSHGGGEGSSQGYAQWQVDRSQDEVFMAAQEAAGQQRDPQDLRTKVKTSSPDRLPVTTTTQSSISTMTATTITKPGLINSLSMSDVSDMLYQFYKANSAAAPKNNKFEKYPRVRSPPQAVATCTIPVILPTTTKLTVTQANQVTDTPHPVLNVCQPMQANSSTAVTKNVNGDEMANKEFTSTTSPANIKKQTPPFHPRIKYSSVNNKSVISSVTSSSPAIPAPAVVSSPVIQAPVLPPPPAAAAIAAAFFRDGYHNFHQQIRAQELLNQQNPQHTPPIPPLPSKPQFYMQNFLKKDNRSSENDLSSSEEHDDEEEDDSKYPEIDDIHLIEGSKSGYTNQMSLSMDADYMSDESHKYSMIAAHALRSLEYSFSEYGSGSPGEEPLYQCRHCGKKYRWKSTLRRHENVECGGKEPSHQCPYCPYKSKQRDLLTPYWEECQADESGIIDFSNFSLENVKKEDRGCISHRRVSSNSRRKVTEYLCAECGKSYKHRGNLGRHVKYECGKPGIFACPVCDRRFHQGCNLQRHVSTLHMNHKRKS